MELTLETVRNVLREPFGRDCFIASFITAVAPDEACPTACIDAAGRMRYNPCFASQWLQNKCELFCLIAHELCHCVFRHSTHGYGELENLGEDALINAFLSQVFPVSTGEGVLFRRFYQPEGIEGLLRPESRLQTSRYGQLYGALYGHRMKLSSGEVIQTLRVLTPQVTVLAGITLLGSHGKEGGSLAETALEGIAEEFARGAAQARLAGRGGALVDLFRQRLRSAVSLRRAVLRKYTSNQRMDRFLKPLRARRQGVSPVPVRPSKRELVLLAAGVPVVHFRRPMHAEAKIATGLAVYLDVSGSVEQELPRILGVIARMQDVLRSIFLFSTQVEEVPFQRLLQGELKTTYGTSFDCVAASVLEHRYQRVVVITDGLASLDDELASQLKRRRVRLLTILFGIGRGCDPLAAHGEVVRLEDVTD